jgi:hypothetical protein
MARATPYRYRVSPKPFGHGPVPNTKRARRKATYYGFAFGVRLRLRFSPRLRALCAYARVRALAAVALNRQTLAESHGIYLENYHTAEFSNS